MSFLSKITGKAVETAQDIVQTQAKRLPNRFTSEGFMSCGAAIHEPRTNSSKEIIDSLKLIASEHREQAVKCAKKNLPEYQKLAELKAKDIEEFLKNIDSMSQRHLSLAHDVVDLSNTHTLISHEIFPTINFNVHGTINGKPKTLMGYVLDKLSLLSKENPKAVDLAESVVSHSDETNSKFFLWKFVDNFPFGGEKQAEAAEGLVDAISKRMLKGLPSMDLGPNCKEQKFFNMLANLCSQDSKSENLKLFKQALDVIDNVAPKFGADIKNIDAIRLGDTEKIAQNLKVLPEVMENADKQGLKTFDVAEFLTKNTNLD